MQAAGRPLVGRTILAIVCGTVTHQTAGAVRTQPALHSARQHLTATDTDW